MAHWSSITVIQWFGVSCSILRFLFDILKISGILSELITFATFYMNFSEILEKASFVLTFKWTNLHESAVIRPSTYEYDINMTWIFL